MSGKSFRPPLRGVIYRGKTMVGGVELSGDGQPFIDQFNREYARLGLRVEIPQTAEQADEASPGEERR